MRVKFTTGRITSFTCPPGKSAAFLWDTEVPGFGLKASPGGSRKFVLESRLTSGSTVRMTIGDANAWTIDAAQVEARRLQTLIDRGLDPRQEKENLRLKALAAQKEAKRQTLTLGDLWLVYLEARKPRWSERSYHDHLRLSAPGGKERKNGKGTTIAGPLVPLMPMSLTELSGQTIAQWLNAEATNRPTTAALSFRYLRACIRWAADIPEYKDLIPPGAWSARVVRDSVPRTRAKEGDCLQREQLASWFAAVRELHSPVISAYLQALLLTGARREEMASLRWTDVDFQWRSLTIRDKVEGNRTIPLPPYLVSLLAGLKRRNDSPPSFTKLEKMREEGRQWHPSPWVFSSAASADGKIAEPRIAHNQALSAAGLPHVTLHGLRRSFGTLCEWVEMPSGISAQIMGHKPSALAEKHYRRRPLDLLRMWHDKIEAWMLLQAGIDFEPARTAI
jgi:integrase